MKKILVIAPHPDDEVLGCGGTIAKYAKKGNEVELCIVTKGYTPDWSEEFLQARPKEIAEANKILGIRKTYFLDYPTVKLDTISQKKLNEALIKVIQKSQPQIIYLPHRGDLCRDHQLVFEAVLVAARPRAGNSVKKLLSYETLSETEWGQPIEPFIPNVYVDISETLPKKIEAMQAYGTEIKQNPHPRSLPVVEALAKKRGSEAGLEFAEAFMLIRDILF